MTEKLYYPKTRFFITNILLYMVYTRKTVYSLFLYMKNDGKPENPEIHKIRKILKIGKIGNTRNIRKSGLKPIWPYIALYSGFQFFNGPISPYMALSKTFYPAYTRVNMDSSHARTHL